MIDPNRTAPRLIPRWNHGTSFRLIPHWTRLNIDVPVLDLGDHNKVVDALVDEALKAIELDLAQAIVLGCTGFVDVAERVQQTLQEKGHDTIVMEAARSALMMLELYAAMGLKHNRLTYLPPREKQRKWWGE